MYKRSVSFAVLPLLLAIEGAQAQQQNHAGTTASPQAVQSLKPAVPPPDQGGADQGYFFNLRPYGEDFGRSLADRGVYVVGKTVTQGLGNVSGGVKQGGFSLGYTSLGVDIDTNKMFGFPAGGAFHFLVSDLEGKNPANYAGDVYSNNRTFSYYDAVRLNEFSYEQLMFDDKLDVRVGRVPVNNMFDFSELYCTFITALCATPGAYTFDRGYQSYLTAAWAGTAHVTLPEHLYFNVGVYEDEPRLTTRDHFNWPGPDWAPDQFRGVTLPVQFGYQTDFSNDPYPRSYDVGFFYDTGDYADPLRNAAGSDRNVFGGAARLDHGKSGLWLQGQQVIWRPDMTTRRALWLFGGANFTTSGNPNIDSGFFAGLVLKGTFASRPNDSFGIQGQILRLNGAYSQGLNDQYVLAHLAPNAKSTESNIEVNYGIALAPGIELKPFAQLILNPDGVGFKATSIHQDSHALFLGAAFIATFPDAFGMPTLHLSSHPS